MSTAHGGPTFALQTISQALANAGITIDVCTTNADRSGTSRISPVQPTPQFGGNTYTLPRTLHPYTISLPLSRWLNQYISNYDIVHLHGVFTFPTDVAAWLARKKNIPYIIRPLGILNNWGVQNQKPMLKKIWLKWLIPLLQKASAIHFTSQTEATEAQRLVANIKSVVIPLGIDTSEYAHIPPKASLSQNYPQLENKSIILFLSRLDPKKGLDILSSAFQLVLQQHPSTHLVIAGDGDNAYVDSMKALVRNLGVQENITFVGYVAGMQKKTLLAAADMFVLPSYSENFGVAVVEAMAAGLPVIVSDQVGIAEDIARAQAGIVTKCNVEDIARAISDLLQNPSRSKEMRANAIRLVDEHFSARTCCNQLIQLYENILVPQTGLGDS